VAACSSGGCGRDGAGRLLLVPGLVLVRVHHVDEEAHVGVVLAADVVALARVEAGFLDIEVEAVVDAGDEVPVEEEVLDVEGVHHVERHHPQLHRLVRRHDQYGKVIVVVDVVVVGGAHLGVPVGVHEPPAPLEALDRDGDGRLGGQGPLLVLGVEHDPEQHGHDGQRDDRVGRLYGDVVLELGRHPLPPRPLPVADQGVGDEADDEHAYGEGEPPAHPPEQRVPTVLGGDTVRGSPVGAGHQCGRVVHSWAQQ
jgi:hypothetical protein